MSTHQILTSRSYQSLTRDQRQYLQDAVYEIALTSSFEQLPTTKTFYISGCKLTISSQDDGIEYVYKEDGSVTKLCIIRQTIVAVSKGFWTCFNKTIELEKLNYFPPLDTDTDQNMASPNFAGEQADSVPPSVEELGAPLELAEQAVEENPVSPASEPFQNMASPNFAGEQANSVPSSVDQLGKPSTPKFRPYHVPNCATHMTPANFPADFVPSRVWIMDFRNLQYRRHVKHLVDHTDVASNGSNTINTSDYAYSS